MEGHRTDIAVQHRVVSGGVVVVVVVWVGMMAVVVRAVGLVLAA